MVRVMQGPGTAGRPGRAGFSLPELLVVISIMAVLLLLSTAAVLKFGSTGPRKATEAQLRSIKSKFDTQWKAVVDKARAEPIPTAPVNFQSLAQTAAGATSPADPRVRAKYVEIKLAQAFPTSIAEALDPGLSFSLSSQIPPWPGYVKYLAGTAAPGTPPNEVGLCLLMILERGPQNTGVSADELPKASFPVNTAGVQGMCLVDGWQRPFVFTRNAGGKSLTPLIMSAGADGIFGASFNFATLADDGSPAFKDNLNSVNVP